MLLAAAKILSTEKARLELLGNAANSVKFFFQPAEEGGAGAKAMIEDGCMNDPTPDEVLIRSFPNYK